MTLHLVWLPHFVPIDRDLWLLKGHVFFVANCIHIKIHKTYKMWVIKIESILFVPENLTFSENLRCLNLPLLVGALSQKRSLSLTCFVFAGQNVHSGKFKHLKYSENVKFSGTNSIDSILVLDTQILKSWKYPNSPNF